MSNDLRTYLSSELRLHPRVAYQGLFSQADKQSLIQGLPEIKSFRSSYAGAIAVLDWDHELPTQSIPLRLFGYYKRETLDAGYEAYDDRLELIGERDRYPEFDVPDFNNLGADEAYEIEIQLDGSMGDCRLTSSWRREVSSKDAKRAVTIAKTSKAFREIRAENRMRPRGLGDLEAVSWTPPCESKHADWTLDVWYLLSFDGRVGKGQSLLVDLGLNDVVDVREFSVRAN